jgi:hypothetical protein
MVKIRPSVRQSTAPLCSVCDGRRRQLPIILCVECAHPDRVRTYCAKCRIRLNLALEEAQDLFSKAGLTITRTGLVFLFPDGCASCCEDGGGAPEIYVIDEPQDDGSVRS